jgi:predicted ATP-grasp superfamily ATP-dependent carboligase
MRFFVYEFVTGGGTWDTTGSIDPAGSLLDEGAAMAKSIVADLLAGGIQVTAMLDVRLQEKIQPACPVESVANSREERRIFDRLVRDADATLLIAPEIGGALLERCRRIESLGGRLASPDSRFVAIAADKQATAECLSSVRVRVPEGVRLSARLDGIGSALFPAVLKPCDGAGSWEVCRVDDLDQLHRRLDLPPVQRELLHGNLRLERFVPGLAASVAVLSGPKQRMALEPCQQVLAEEGLAYRGGRLPLAAPLVMRARQLALAAIEALPPTIGYVGVDLVLGAAADGGQDYVIEINPRLTSSYVGLRAACRQNLASAMLDIAAGRSATLSFAPEPLEFRSDGTIQARLHLNP